MKHTLFTVALLIATSVFAQGNSIPEANNDEEVQPTPVQLCMEACLATYETPSAELKACVSQCQLGEKKKN